MKIVIASDNPILNKEVSRILTQNDYHADLVCSGKTTCDMLLKSAYDLLILGDMLSDMPGIELLKKVRLQNWRIPTIFMGKGDEMDMKSEILKYGADEYLSILSIDEELVAVVRSLLRRSLLMTSDNCLYVGRLVLNFNTCEAIVGKEAFHLTIKETEILALLMKNVNTFLSKDRIINTIWGMYRGIQPSNIEIHIHRIRKSPFYKKAGIIIQTRRGIGYCLKVDLRE